MTGQRSGKIVCQGGIVGDGAFDQLDDRPPLAECGVSVFALN
jgi:hypothetical protein